MGAGGGGGETARRCTPSPTPQPSGLPLGIPPHILPPEPAFFQRGNSRRSTTGVLSASNAAPRREAAGSGTHGGGVAPHRTAPLPPFSPLRFRAHGGAVPLCPVLHGRGRPAGCADPIAYRSSRGRRQLSGAEPRSGGIARRQRMRGAPQQRARIGRAPPDPLRRHHPRRPHRAAGSRSGERAARPGGAARLGPRLPWMPVWCVMAPLRSASPRPGQETAPPPASTLPEPAPGGAAARTAPGRSRTPSRARPVRGEPAGFHVRRVVAAAAAGRPRGTARRRPGIGTAFPAARPAAVPPAQVPPRRRGEPEGR